MSNGTVEPSHEAPSGFFPDRPLLFAGCAEPLAGTWRHDYDRIVLLDENRHYHADHADDVALGAYDPDDDPPGADATVIVRFQGFAGDFRYFSPGYYYAPWRPAAHVCRDDHFRRPEPRREPRVRPHDDTPRIVRERKSEPGAVVITRYGADARPQASRRDDRRVPTTAAVKPAPPRERPSSATVPHPAPVVRDRPVLVSPARRAETPKPDTAPRRNDDAGRRENRDNRRNTAPSPRPPAERRERPADPPATRRSETPATPRRETPAAPADNRGAPRSDGTPRNNGDNGRRDAKDRDRKDDARDRRR